MFLWNEEIRTLFNQCQTLLGATGSGKTFTMANVIAQLNKPTFVIAHNKTLAAQLYGEFKEFSGKCGRVIYELVCLGVKKRDIWRCLVLFCTEFVTSHGKCNERELLN